MGANSSVDAVSINRKSLCEGGMVEVGVVAVVYMEREGAQGVYVKKRRGVYAKIKVWGSRRVGQALLKGSCAYRTRSA